MSASRTATLRRTTAETDISLTLTFDGQGHAVVQTGIPFFDHMLTAFAKHSRIDLEVKVKGDLEVDFHHTVEDTGIVLGQAIDRALGEKRGLCRYGWALLPMDETLARVAIDFGGRPFLAYEAPAQAGPIGSSFPFTLVEEFLRAFAVNARANLHVALLSGRDSHHMAEAVFKGLAKAVDQAATLDPRIAGDIPSTKESL